MAGFRPGWVPTLAMLGAVALLVSLGTWQVRRHHWRQEVLAQANARIDAPPLAFRQALVEAPEDRQFRRVRVEGRYDKARSILVQNVPREGRSGARVLTPLLVEGEAGPEAVLVDRGWVPWARAGAFLDEDAERPEEGTAEVTGLLFELALEGARPAGGGTPRREWVRFDPRRHAAPLQEQLPYRLAPFLVQRSDDGSGALPLGGIQRPTSPVSHVSYAITWYSMAAIAVGVWIGLGRQRARESR